MEVMESIKRKNSIWQKLGHSYLDPITCFKYVLSYTVLPSVKYLFYIYVDDVTINDKIPSSSSFYLKYLNNKYQWSIPYSAH